MKATRLLLTPRELDALWSAWTAPPSDMDIARAQVRKVLRVLLAEAKRQRRCAEVTNLTERFLERIIKEIELTTTKAKER